jgi:sterol desaturase/sphingolipid hydroxylase (fatty acid hydroxylase superfamily)
MNPIAFAVPVFFLLILLELWMAHSRGVSVYSLKDSLTSINVGIMSEFSKAMGGLISVVMYTLISDRYGAFVWDVSHPLTWISALLIYDFCYYWVHRTGHEINILWASHVVHHSSEEFNLSTALRQSSTGFLFRWIFYIPLALLGYPVKVFIVVGLIDFVYQYWVHTQLVGKLGWFEYVVVTPSNHRVHHGQNDYCIDKNYGGVFSFWDRMFGTYADERDDEKPIYGIRKPLESWNPLWANLHHFVQIWRQIKSAQNWRHRLMYLFAKPSWTPEKEDATEVFVSNRFNRFDTPASSGLLHFAFVGTLLGAVLLMVYFYLQPRLAPSIGVGYCVVMVLGIAGIGWRMTHERLSQSVLEEKDLGHAK